MKYKQLGFGLLALATLTSTQVALADNRIIWDNDGSWGHNRCLPEITEVHNAVCTDNGTLDAADDKCELHIRGQCLTNYDGPNPDTNKYRIMIADNDTFKQAEWYEPTVMGATDLHYRIVTSTIQCGVFGTPKPLTEDRMVKLQQKLGSKWIDVDKSLVTFTAYSNSVCAPVM